MKKYLKKNGKDGRERKTKTQKKRREGYYCTFTYTSNQEMLLDEVFEPKLITQPLTSATEKLGF